MRIPHRPEDVALQPDGDDHDADAEDDLAAAPHAAGSYGSQTTQKTISPLPRRAAPADGGRARPVASARSRGGGAPVVGEVEDVLEIGQGVEALPAVYI